LADTKHKISGMKKSIENKLEDMVSRFDAKANSQDKQLNGIALQLSKLMSSLGMQAQPIIPPRRDPGLMLQPITPTPHSLADAADDACMFQDPDSDISMLISRVSNEKLREHLEHITSVHVRIAAEVDEQAAAVQRQSAFIAHVCESMSCIPGMSDHWCSERVNDPCPGDRLDQGGIYLGQVLGAVQSDAAQLGYSIDRLGELMMSLGKASKVAGLEAFPFESVIRNRISSM